MAVEDVQADGADGAVMHRLVTGTIRRAASDAVLRIRVHGVPTPTGLAVLRAASIRALAPATMNVEVALLDVERRPGPLIRLPRARS